MISKPELVLKDQILIYLPFKNMVYYAINV